MRSNCSGVMLQVCFFDRSKESVVIQHGFEMIACELLRQDR